MTTPTQKPAPTPGAPTHPDTPPPGEPTQGLPGVPDNTLPTPERPADPDYGVEPVEPTDVQKIRTLSALLVDAINDVGTSREASIAITNIETGTMWAVRAAYMARDSAQPR